VTPLGAVVGGTAAQTLRLGAVPAAGLLDRGVEHLLPVHASLAPLLPLGGLPRGSTVAVGGSASLLLALLAEASRAGHWCAVVGLPTLGAVAAEEAGVSLSRLALVPDPGLDAVAVVAALVDGVDVVVVGAPGRLSAPDTRRLAARARQRGTVLVPYGSWHGADLRLSTAEGSWHGLGRGHGHLRSRRVVVRAEGRGSAGRPRQVAVWLPGVPVGTGPGAVPAAPPPLLHPRRAVAG